MSVTITVTVLSILGGALVQAIGFAIAIGIIYGKVRTQLENLAADVSAIRADLKGVLEDMTEQGKDIAFLMGSRRRQSTGEHRDR
jgi:ABC-type uncharacterized transport system fused permease/ATPase subunit